VAAPGVGVVAAGVDGLAMLPDCPAAMSTAAIGAELPVMGAGVVSGIGVRLLPERCWPGVSRHVVSSSAQAARGGRHARQQG
jgi:hypothetical protein